MGTKVLILLSAMFFSNLLYAEDYKTKVNFKYGNLIYSVTSTNSHKVYDIDNPNSDLNLRVINTKTNTEITSISLKDKYYGTVTYGKPMIYVSKGESGKIFVIAQLRHGGDGDHTENILRLYSFENNKLTPILEQNMDTVKYTESNGNLKSITGRYVETLCTVCDGWEVSEQKDIFFVPIKINMNTLKVEADITQEQKKSLRSRFEDQSAKNITEQLSYGRDEYPKDVELIKKRLFNVLK